MSHKPQKQQFDFKHGPPPEFDDDLMELIEQAVKERADQREANQGADDGRNTED